MALISGIDFVTGDWTTAGAWTLVASIDRAVGTIDPFQYTGSGGMIVPLSPNEDIHVPHLHGFGIDGSGNPYFDTDPFNVPRSEKARVFVNPAAGTITLETVQ